MLLWTFGFTLYVVWHDVHNPKKKYYSDYPYITYISLGIGTILMALLLCQTKFFERPPCNYILLVLFTVTWAVFVSSFTKDYDWRKVILTVGLVAAISTGLSIIGFCLQNELYWCFGVIATMLASLIPMGVFLYMEP